MLSKKPKIVKLEIEEHETVSSLREKLFESIESDNQNPPLVCRLFKDNNSVATIDIIGREGFI